MRFWRPFFSFVFESVLFWYHIIITSFYQRLTFRFLKFLVSRLLSICWGFRFWFWRIWSRKKVSVLENLVSEKKSRFRKIWSWKNLSISVSVKILVSSFSAHHDLTWDEEGGRGVGARWLSSKSAQGGKASQAPWLLSLAPHLPTHGEGELTV